MAPTSWEKSSWRSSAATFELRTSSSPFVESCDGVDYVAEPVPGLDRASDRGLAVATGEIVAFTDDDTVVDSRWAIAQAFAM